MDLRAQLDRYEVTAIPPRRAALKLVWNEPDVQADDAARASVSGGSLIAILDDYRITRVPVRAAS